jgi:magnesium and cobalt transporter
MDDTGDVPSIAAHSAQVDQDEKIPGLWTRLKQAIRTPEVAQADAETPTETPRAAGSVLGMLNLRRMRVEDVAIPKPDIVAVPVTISKDELVEVFRSSGMTRLPVYEGTLDTPIGSANMKDFALLHGFDGGSTKLALREMVRPLIYVPPSMPLGVLLQKMQAERIHMALVIDEYGGTDGLVTIEDVIEQVVGEIEDEHDVEEVKSWVMEKPGCYLVQARTDLDDFEIEIGMTLTNSEEIDEEEIDTLGGLVTMLAGHLPARGEVVVHPDGHEFDVIDADPRRIKRLRVRLHAAKNG